MIVVSLEPGKLVRAVTPRHIDMLLARGRVDAKAAFASGDTEHGLMLARRNAGYLMFFAPIRLKRRPSA